MVIILYHRVVQQNTKYNKKRVADTTKKVSKVSSQPTKHQHKETLESIKVSDKEGTNKDLNINGTQSLMSQDVHHLTKRDLPFIYQRDKVKSCTNAASTSIISGGKAVDFAAFAAGVLTLVINVNNNINNNNNNNNNLNINAVDSSNIVANFNTNNANQVQINV